MGGKSTLFMRRPVRHNPQVCGKHKFKFANPHTKHFP